MGDRRGESLASWNLGVALQEEGDVAGAIAALQVRVDFEHHVSHPDAEQHARQVEELRSRIG